MQDPFNLIVQQLEALILLNKQLQILRKDVASLRKDVQDLTLLSIVHQQETRELLGEEVRDEDEDTFRFGDISLN